MTAYNKSPFGPSPVLMVGGRAEFLFGSLNDTVSPTAIRISSVANNGTASTVVGTIFSGNAPLVGDNVSLQGTVSNAGAFNVTNVSVSSVSVNALTGVITFTFPLTTTAIATTPDSGFAVFPTPIRFDSLTAVGASKQATSAENDPSEDDQRSYSAQVFFGTIPTSATVVLQGALVDQDSAYQTLGTVATVVSSAVTASFATFPSANYKFLRFNVTALTGTGTIAATLMG